MSDPAEMNIAITLRLTLYLCCLKGDEVRVLCIGNTVDDSAERTTSEFI